MYIIILLIMKNVLLLDQENYTSEWHNNFEMSEKDELICK